jgi:CheY-like chemotaxis protein
MDATDLTPYYFPTTVVFIDDDPVFLETLSGSMPDELALRAFKQPRAALDHIEEANHGSPVPARCFVVPNGDAPDTTIRLDLTPIAETLYSEQRFNEVSVAVIDYDMPHMNGLEVCEALNNLPLKKVLLTGKADETIAIEAFNAGLIDHFIAKSHADMTGLLKDTIRRLQLAYFRQASVAIMLGLGPRFDFLSEPAFYVYFSRQMTIHNWVEYYLDPVAGGLLCISASGQPTLLLISHRDQLPSMAENAQQSPELASLLRRGEVLTNPHNQQGDWRQSLTLAQAVPDSQWLVARVEDPTHLYINSERLFNYQYFLEILDYMATAAKA